MNIRDLLNSPHDLRNNARPTTPPGGAHVPQGAVVAQQQVDRPQAPVTPPPYVGPSTPKRPVGVYPDEAPSPPPPRPRNEPRRSAALINTRLQLGLEGKVTMAELHSLWAKTHPLERDARENWFLQNHQRLLDANFTKEQILEMAIEAPASARLEIMRSLEAFMALGFSSEQFVRLATLRGACAFLPKLRKSCHIFLQHGYGPEAIVAFVSQPGASQRIDAFLMNQLQRA